MPNYACAVVATLPSHVLQRARPAAARRRRSWAAITWSSCSAAAAWAKCGAARHRLLARSAAIKLVRPELLGAEQRRRGAEHAAPVRARGAGHRRAELAAHDSRVRLRRHRRRHVLLRDGAARRTRPRVAGARVRPAAGRPGASSCCGRSATRWPTRTRAAWCTATSSRPTSTSAGWASTTTSSRCSTSAWSSSTTRARCEHDAADRRPHDDRHAGVHGAGNHSRRARSTSAPTSTRSAASPTTC